MEIKKIKVMLTVLLAVISLSAFAEESQGEKEPVVKVPPIKVCMVNDQVFEKDQIPVEVEGKTYYGCCQMCKKTLAERKEFRVSIDPVSGKEVDKAAAVIGSKKDGKTLYFENEKTFNKYNSKAKQKDAVKE